MTTRRYMVFAWDQSKSDGICWVTHAYDAADAVTQWDVYRRCTTGANGEPTCSAAQRVEPAPLPVYDVPRSKE